MPNRLTVLLVDDHALVRRGFRRMLEDEETFEVVGEASDGAEAVKRAEELRPKVIVMDCALPQMNGIEATRKILAKAAGYRDLDVEHAFGRHASEASDGSGSARIYSEERDGSGFGERNQTSCRGKSSA